MPVPDTSVSQYNNQSGAGHFGEFGTLTRWRHIVPSSLGASALRIHARKDTHTPVPKHLPVVRSVHRDAQH